MHYDYDDGELSPKQRKAKLQQQIIKLKKELEAKGNTLNPIEVKPRAKIAKNFWAKKWYDNLNTYEDLDHRLPIGRQLLSLGAVLDLKVDPLKITAKIYDESTLYSLIILFDKVDSEQKQRLAELVQSELCSLSDLLLGKLSEDICHHITHSDHGLFPKLDAISFDCNCTDYASFCCHAAACLCSVVVLFNEDPAIFFKLRGLEPQSLLEAPNKKEESSANLSHEEMSEIFGINLAE